MLLLIPRSLLPAAAPHFVHLPGPAPHPHTLPPPHPAHPAHLLRRPADLLVQLVLEQLGRPVDVRQHLGADESKARGVERAAEGGDGLAWLEGHLWGGAGRT